MCLCKGSLVTSFNTLCQHNKNNLALLLLLVILISFSRFQWVSYLYEISQQAKPNLLVFKLWIRRAQAASCILLIVCSVSLCINYTGKIKERLMFLKLDLVFRQHAMGAYLPKQHPDPKHCRAAERSLGVQVSPPDVSTDAQLWGKH